MSDLRLAWPATRSTCVCARVLARHERCERPTVRLLARAGVRLLARVGARVLARHERPPFC